MSHAVSQFLYLKVKPSVRPEDPTSEEGLELLDLFRATKHQSGYQSSSWGRTVEDENTIVWLVEWADARGSVPRELLLPFLEPSNQTPIAIYTTLQAPISSTSTLTKNPVTELCVLPFPSNLSSEQTRELNGDLIRFRAALVEQLPQEEVPLSWAMGHVDRPSPLQHGDSPTGQAVAHFLAVGWASIAAHEKARETPQFKESIAYVREKMLPPIPGLEMKHVSFKKVE